MVLFIPCTTAPPIPWFTGAGAAPASYGSSPSAASKDQRTSVCPLSATFPRARRRRRESGPSFGRGAGDFFLPRLRWPAASELGGRLRHQADRNSPDMDLLAYSSAVDVHSQTVRASIVPRDRNLNLKVR